MILALSLVTLMLPLIICGAPTTVATTSTDNESPQDDSKTKLGDVAPPSSMQHITLKLEPDLLKDHKVVITMESLPKTLRGRNDDQSSSSDKDNEGTDQEISLTISITSEKQDSNQTSPSDSSEVVTTTTTPIPVTTTTKTHVTTPTSKKSKPTTTTPEDDNVPIVKTPSLFSGDDEDTFLLNFPNLICPEGQQPDHNGKCREVFWSGK